MICAASASLSRPVVSSLYWAIFGLESSTGCTLTSAALCWYSQPMSSTSRLMVAENIDRLSRCFISVDDVLDVLVKAHVQHLVGLVQHDGLDVGDIDGVVAVVVHQAARRGNDDLAAGFELALLLVHARRRHRRRRF